MCYSEYDLIYCFGDMLELGDMTQEAHRHLAARISQSADEVYLVGQAMQTYLYDELVKL
jgi:UDP-N-acetylmuramyl pentapeptide synthase